MRRCRTFNPRDGFVARLAFTLVELLVVIGIIAILVAILLPTLARAREHGRRVACASNLRQLANAFIMYGNENRGWFPGSGISRSMAGGPRWSADWIHYLPGEDLNGSSVAKYLGAAVDPSVFRCPSDENWPARRKSLANANTAASMQAQPYPYSYCMNRWLACDEALGTHRRPPADRVCFEKFNRVKDPSRVSMLGEVDERVMFCSAWEPSAGTGNGRMVWTQLLSARHDVRRPPEEWKPFFIPPASYPDARGNVAFVDGHVDYTMRRVAMDPRTFAPQLTYLHDYPWAE